MLSSSSFEVLIRERFGSVVVSGGEAVLSFEFVDDMLIPASRVDRICSKQRLDRVRKDASCRGVSFDRGYFVMQSEDHQTLTLLH